MTPKEKAAYLVVKYMSKVVSMKLAKECALVAAEELIYEHMFDDSAYSDRRHDYWEEVKKEIEKV